MTETDHLHPVIVAEMIQRLNGFETVMESTHPADGKGQRDRKNVLRGLRIARNALQQITNDRNHTNTSDKK